MHGEQRTGARPIRWAALAVAGALLLPMPGLAPVAPANAVETPATEPADPPAEAPGPETPEPTPAPSPEDPGAGEPGAVEPPAETPPADDPAEEAPSGETPGEGPADELTSDSPGPASARPWGSAAADALTRAMAQRPLIGDDYPAKYKRLPMEPIVWDEWNFAHRQCTSFVAWRLNTANGVPFSNQYLGLTRWGNAADWAASARSVGIRVDTTPEIGAVAWSGANYKGASWAGHVAWVADVLPDGRVVIEEYNYGWAGAYYTRTVQPGDFQGYIHIRDLTSPFDRVGSASVAGAPMVGGTLTAETSGWSPAPAGYRYRWLRNGAAISGATAKTYQPVMADLGARISVEITADRPRYRSTSKTSAASGAVSMTDADGDGLDDTQAILPWNSDVNGDGLPDAVGMGTAGVQVALASPSGLGAQRQWLADFGTASGWSVRAHPRTVVDVNGDGKADVVGFGDSGVYVATSTGSGFRPAARWLSGFGAADTWAVEQHPRTLADVTGDGLPDVVGFASDGVLVAAGTGTGFAAAKRWSDGFGAASGWRVDRHPRLLVDMNNDGRDDLVGFSNSGVSVALSTGSGFSAPRRWASDFGYASGWRVESHVRTLADVNGDGRPDVVGFGLGGVYVATNTGSGLGATRLWRSEFGTATGWRVGQHPRVLADVNGDGRADVVGFGGGATAVALSTGTSFSAPANWTSEFSAAQWRADRHPRVVTDTDGDGRADIVGFANTGMRVARSTGSAFAASRVVLPTMGRDAGWEVSAHPRSVGLRTLSAKPTPQVSGDARLGQTLAASAGSWRPAPVALSYQWRRDGVAIRGATGAKYQLVEQDVGAAISVRVTARKLGFAPVARDSRAQTAQPGRLSARTPSVSGTARAGSRLQVATGDWGPQPVALRVQWNRNGAPIAGATGSAYTLTEADVARRISVTVTGSKSAYETASRTSDAVTVAGVPALPESPPFADVPRGHQFYRETSWMFTSGMSTGVRQASGKPKYQPKAAVSREAMAAFLFRLDALKSYRAPARSPFTDVGTGDRFFREIAWMRESGLSTGIRTSAGLAYAPGDGVSREAMAAFLFRLEAPDGYRPPRTSPFSDVPTTHKFYREIAWMSESGLSTGIRQPSGKPRYAPREQVSREAMAAFLYRMETSG